MEEKSLEKVVPAEQTPSLSERMGPRLRSVDASGPPSTSFWGSPSWQVDHNEGLMRTTKTLGEPGWMTVYFDESRLVLP